MRSRYPIPLVLAVVLLASPFVSAQAAVHARVDRTVLADGETVELTLESADTAAEPKLDALLADFEVLSTARNRRVQIARGKVESRDELILTLAPRRTGTLLIPPLDVGGELTEPITLKVVAGTEAKGAARTLYLETEVEPRSVVVQQQIIYTIRLVHALDLRDGALTLPAVPDAIIEKLGDDVTYDELRDGRRYSIVERRYAVFPQKPGTLKLPAVRFSGKAIARGTAPARGPFDSDPFGVLFTQAKPVRARSKEEEVFVGAPPAGAVMKWWLPATRVALAETWVPDPPVFRAGEPVTRVLTFEADGLTAQQLPELALGDVAGVRHYPDQAERETRVAPRGVTALKTQRIAYVAARPGTYTLPALEIPWWDVRTNRVQVAKLPARTIEVAAPSGGAGVPAAPASALPVPGTAAPAPTPQVAATPAPPAETAPGGSADWVWVAIAVVAVLAWLVTLGLWWRGRRARAATASGALAGDVAPNLRAARAALRAACKQAQPAAIRDAVLRYALARWPEDAPRSLGELAARADSEAVRAALTTIERCLYMPSEERSVGIADAARVIDDWIGGDKADPPARVAPGALQPLYPQPGGGVPSST